MSERLKFIARLEQGERLSELCREFGISRKTGHKLKKRYRSQGAQALYDQSRRPHRSPQRTSATVVEQVVGLRQRYPTWGPKKLKQRLCDLHPEIRWPAASTIGELLKDAGLVDGRKRRRRACPSPGPRRESQAPNELWCIDYKGEFRLQDHTNCYPLTVSDHFSRYLVACEAMVNTKVDPTAQALEVLFAEFGLPDAIRTDNGVPFASTGRVGFTTLSVWLMRLGIRLERIDPGHPEQNGRHERMHRTLKAEATRPAQRTSLQQQEVFDEFRAQYNDERPHEALQMKTPAKVYAPSKRALPTELPELVYPLHDDVRAVDHRGHIRLSKNRSTYVAIALAGQTLGLRQLHTGTWLISFMDQDLGYIDQETNRFIELRDIIDPNV